MGIPMLKIRRRSRDRLILHMGIPKLVRRHFYIVTAPDDKLWREIGQVKLGVITYPWSDQI